MSSYRAFRLLFFLLACGAIPVTAANMAPRVREGLAAPLLTGHTRSADGQALAGVGISARAQGSTITTTVYSGDDGFFAFPALDAGKYDLWTLAVGFGTKRANPSLRPKSGVRQDFVLEPIEGSCR
jgi:hypothetical protein